jgi:hypothetical protein
MSQLLINHQKQQETKCIHLIAFLKLLQVKLVEHRINILCKYLQSIQLKFLTMRNKEVMILDHWVFLE